MTCTCTGSGPDILAVSPSQHNSATRGRAAWGALLRSWQPHTWGAHPAQGARRAPCTTCPRAAPTAGACGRAARGRPSPPGARISLGRQRAAASGQPCHPLAAAGSRPRPWQGRREAGARQPRPDMPSRRTSPPATSGRGRAGRGALAAGYSASVSAHRQSAPHRTTGPRFGPGV